MNWIEHLRFYHPKKPRRKWNWKMIFVSISIAFFLLLITPIIVGAITSSDALAGLNATLNAMLAALGKTLGFMLQAFKEYLGAV